MRKKLVALSMAVLMLAVAVVGGTLAYFTDTTDQEVNTFTVGKVGIELTETSVEGTATVDNKTVDLKVGETYEDSKASGIKYGALTPATYYAKAPVVKVDDDSQNAWVFLEVKATKFVSLINLMGVDAYKNGVGGLSGTYPGFHDFVTKLASSHSLREAVIDRWFTGVTHGDWVIMNVKDIDAMADAVAAGTNDKELTVILGYKTEAAKAGTSATFMTGFGMPSTVTQSMMTGDDAYMVVREGKDPYSGSNFNTTSGTPFKLKFKAYAIQADNLTQQQAFSELFPASLDATSAD